MKYVKVGFCMSIGWELGLATLNVVCKHLLELMENPKKEETQTS